MHCNIEGRSTLLAGFECHFFVKENPAPKPGRRSGNSMQAGKSSVLSDQDLDP
jgi:hypothetical protein